MVIKVEKNKDFEGAAKIELLGLPNEVTTEPREITKDSTELVFPVKTTANSPAGKHKTVICRAIDHGQRRADRAHAGHRRIADRHAAAAQGRTQPAAPRPCRRRPPPRPISRPKNG